MRSARNRAFAALAACLLASGCADYMANRDTVTLGVGNAMEANVGIHTIDPFPREAWETDIDGDGKIVARAQRIYLRGGVPVAGAPAGPAGAGAGGAADFGREQRQDERAAARGWAKAGCGVDQR